MDVGMLGTGAVGTTIAGRLVGLGHRVVMGSRTPDNPVAASWAADHGEAADHGTFAAAARFGELLFNCTAGAASLAAIGSTDEDDLDGKVLIDVANPLDFSRGDGSSLSVCDSDSLAEQIQRAHPGSRVVKTLNTVNCRVMVDPALAPGTHVFVSSDDADAKAVATGLVREFGWPADSIVDLGDLASARGAEMYLPLWIRLAGVLDTTDFNIAIVGANPT